MHQIARSIASLLAAVGLLMLGSATLGTLVSVRLAEAGSSAIAIGLVTAAYYAGLTAGSLQAHRIVLRVGHIRAFSAFASAFSAAALLHVMALELPVWAVLRLLEGFCMAGLYICIESWLNDRATPQTRGQVLSLYMVTLYAGMGIGQQLLNLPDPNGTLRFVTISILLSVALIPVALTRSPAPTLPDIRSFGFARLYQASPLGVAAAFIGGAVSGAIYGLAPVFGARSDFGLAGTALFMTVIIFGGVVLQWPLGKLSDRFDRRTVIIGISAALTLISLAMIAAAGLGGQAMLLTITLLFGGLSFTLYPLAVAHTNDHIDKADLVAASGGLILANSAGATIGPLMASLVMSGIGPSGLFGFTAAAALAATLFGLWRVRMRPPPAAEAQGPFVGLPGTTPIATPLDPRSEPEAEQYEFDFGPVTSPRAPH